MYLNKALIYGNLTRDPEMRALPSGLNVTSFSVATNRVYKDRDGVRQESTDYHNIVVFGRQAETVNQYLKKGNGAFVEGRLQTSSWEKDGQKQYRTEIIADRVQFGPKISGASSSSATTQNEPKDKQEKSDTSSRMPDYPEEDINPEDIPF